MKKLTSALLAALAFLTGGRAAWAGDPRLEWYTIETAHFRVSFHGGLAPLAQRAAAIAERAYTVVGKNLDQTPSERVEILLTDDSDLANGSAGAIPYDAIRLYATAPDDMSPLGDYDDWLNELLTHEFTHILHVDNVSGLPSLLNRLIGKTTVPNQWQPRWILEGLAVAMETAHTSGGRLRSTQFEMALRADVLEHRFATLDQVSGAPRRFPSGNVWYLYGSAFVSFINDTYGPNTFAAVADDYGAQLVPWGINRSIRRVTGRTYEELYDGFRKTLEKRYEAQAASIRARGLHEGRRLTARGEVALGARLTNGCSTLGKPSVVFERDDGNTVGGVYEVALDGSNPEGKLRARAFGQQVSVAPDCSLVFDSGAISGRRYYFQDLFRQLPGTSSREEGDTRSRMTRGLRARHADVSPDGRRVVFVTNDRSTSTLRIADLTPDYQLANVRALVPSAHFEQAYTPRFSPDGRTVAYSAWTTGGYRDVRLVDVATGRFQEPFHDRAIDQQPTFSRDGRHLYFTSDRTGVANVYAYDLATSALSQVTNVLGGAYFPEVSADGRTLIYTGYTSRGWDLFVLDNDPARWRPALPYVSERGRGPAPVLSHAPIRRYDPLQTLRPRQFYLDYGPGALGQQLTITTSGSDIAGLHGIAAAISVPVTRQQERTEPALSLDYAYARRPFYLQLSGFRSAIPRLPEEYVVGEKALATIAYQSGISTGVSIALPGDNESQVASLSYTVAEVYQQLPLPPPDPYSALGREPYRGLLGLLHLGYAYSNVESSNYAISKERGFEVSFGFDYAGRALASESTITSFSATATGYVLMPWLQHHVLAAALSGGTGHGTYPRGLFTLGGYADVPLLDSFRSNLRQSSLRLRGYEPQQFAGSDYNLLNVEYRAPLWYADRGISTLPVFLRSLAGAVFLDYGAAYDQLDLRDPLEAFHGAVGAELWLDLFVGYYIYGNLRLGVAKPLDETVAARDESAPPKATRLQTYVVLSTAF